MPRGIPNDRGEQITAQRRRRNGDALQGKRRRLAVNEAGLDREAYVYRWANDEDTRLYQLTVQDDWEVVTDRNSEIRPDTSGEGSEVAVPVGGGVRSVLLRKPKAYYDEDMKAQQRQIDGTEASLREGSVPGGGNSNNYMPGQGIQITHAQD